ncbi:MAG TPA: hypothetical protein VFV37_02705 [Luteibaculaceae bacterium]|nr:hypothetical protein [Luteibaculaceae bacterium]
MIRFVVAWLMACFSVIAHAQPVPSSSENIDWIVTFGKEAETTWGDDDFIQVFFFLIPKSHKLPIYIRIYDPNTGGKYDQLNPVQPAFNTTTKYTVYGGKGTYSPEDARTPWARGNFRGGNQLFTANFKAENNYDDKWYSFGPINPAEGEYIKEFDGYVFKIISEAYEGNDGNLYRYFLSQSKTENIPVEGSNAFTYKYTFRLKNGRSETAHLYPLIDDNTVSIKQNNFDFDNEGIIKLYSVSKNGVPVKLSDDGNWATSEHPVTKEEKGKSINIQIIKNQSRINDMTFYILNQYDKAVPFFAIPIGGVPKFKFSIGVNYDYINKKRTIGN